jgi:hypothetical protein
MAGAGHAHGGEQAAGDNSNPPEVSSGFYLLFVD